MVVVAYVAGLVTTPAAAIGVWLGLRWWRRLRRSEGHTDPTAEHAVTVHPLPPPPPPQDEAIAMGRVRFNIQKSRVRRRR